MVWFTPMLEDDCWEHSRRRSCKTMKIQVGSLSMTSWVSCHYVTWSDMEWYLLLAVAQRRVWNHGLFIPPERAHHLNTMCFFPARPVTSDLPWEVSDGSRTLKSLTLTQSRWISSRLLFFNMKKVCSNLVPRWRTCLCLISLPTHHQIWGHQIPPRMSSQLPRLAEMCYPTFHRQAHPRGDSHCIKTTDIGSSACLKLLYRLLKIHWFRTKSLTVFCDYDTPDRQVDITNHYDCTVPCFCGLLTFKAITLHFVFAKWGQPPGLFGYPTRYWK